MDILNKMLGLFVRKPTFFFGYLPEPPDPRDVYVDELLGGESTFPNNFITPDTKFISQGGWPICVAMSICRFAEWQHKVKTGEDVTFSALHLFFNGGGTRYGAGVRALLEYARTQGFVLENQCPLPLDMDDLSLWDHRRSMALWTKPTGKYKISGYARVNPNPEDIAKGILRYGEVMTVVAGNGGYWKDNKTYPAGYPYNHLTRWIGFKLRQEWIAMDSLLKERGFDGLHTFNWFYPVESVWTILANIPENWREMRDQTRKDNYPVNAVRYNLVRNFPREVSFAAEMDRAFLAFKNQSVYEASGKFWEVYIRAGVYGGYSLTDLVNDCYNWRRTGLHIFDFDKLRSEFTK